MSGSRKPPPEPADPLDHELAFLVRAGLVTPAPGGEYELTPNGRDWMLWAVWQAVGCPGMPAELELEEVSP